VHRPLRLLAALAVLATLAAGCGDDDDTSAATTTTAADGTTTTAAPPEDDGPVDVVAVDYAFEGLPSRLDSGTQLTLRNDSSTEVHELVAFRLPDDESRTMEELVVLPMEELETLFAGPPAMVLVAPPDDDGFAAFGDGTLAEPGRYAVFCAIPTGADPDEFLRQAQESAGPPDVDGGPPHFTAGMYAEVTVG
jgi:hypothetical protein